MHRSLSGRIGGKWFAISDRLATQFTAFCRASVLCGGELRSRNRPIVRRTQEGAPFEALDFGRSVCSHSQNLPSLKLPVYIGLDARQCPNLENEIGDINFGSLNYVGAEPVLSEVEGCPTCPAERSSAGSVTLHHPVSPRASLAAQTRTSGPA